MSGVFLHYEPICVEQPSGVAKKILSQIRVFERAGFPCALLTLDETSRMPPANSLIRQLCRRLPLSNLDPVWKYKAEFDSMTFMYFRKPPYFSYAMRKVLREIRQRNPQVQIIMEIPTYPYDLEFSFVRDFAFMWKDRHNRKQLAGLIDQIVVVSEAEHRTIFGVPAISIANGIDLSTIDPRLPVVNDVIDICAVANFAKWHGYERLLYGLQDYYMKGGQRDFCLHMVGEGPELPSYERIARNPFLKDRVVFYGMLSGEELNSVYDVSDFGACHMGLHKIGIDVSSGLKSREYLAKGLPMISGCRLDMEGLEEEGFLVEYPNDSSPIDMNAVVAFYDRTYGARQTEREAIVARMRSYAESAIDIGVSMRPILDYLGERTRLPIVG